MAGSYLAALLIAGLVIGALLLVRWLDERQASRGARTFRLRFPRDMASADVMTFIAGLSGVRPPWHRRWLSRPVIGFEVHATHGHIDHVLLVPKAVTGVVLSHLRAALPSVRLDPPEPVDVPALSTAIELRTSTERRPLRTDRLDGVAAALLTSLQPLREGEVVVVQWLVTPSAVPRPPRLPDGSKRGRSNATFLDDGYELSPHAEALRAERAKQAEALYACAGRIAVKAETASRGQYLVERLLGSYQLLSAPGVELRPRALAGSRETVRRTQQRRLPLGPWPAYLNAAEVVGVIGWPVGATALPGLNLGGCRQLPPAADLPSTGCVVAQATFPGSERPVAIAPEDRLLHTLCTGPTGTGKSNLLLSLIVQDMRAGRSVVVVDPKGDLVTEALKRVPFDRTRDVIVLDPADEERPVGLNLLSTEHASAELVAEQTVFVFHQLFSAFWGPRTDDVLRAALLTLMHEPGMTLIEVPLLLTSPAFRRRFVQAVSGDTVGLAPFWAYYEALKPNDQAQVIAPLMNKLRATLLRSRVRNCVGQADPGLHLDEALNSNKLLFVPLRKGTLGDEAAALMGSLFISRLWQTIQTRSDIPESERRPVHLYIDEAQDYLNLPSSVGDMLAQARGLKLAVTLANQHLSQWTPELRQDVLANCRSKVVFQTTAKDARAFEQELRPFLTADDLQGLGRFEVVAQLAVGQRVAPPVTGVTLPPSEETHRERIALAWSRHHYGRDRAELEAAMLARHQTTGTASPIGRQRKRGAA